jgi:hypothetical protein
MHLAALRPHLISSLSACLVACASVAESPGSEGAIEEVGRVVQRSFGSVTPGKVRREPGLSAAQRTLSSSQERSALPVPTYEHKVALVQDGYVTVTSESAECVEGTCVRVVRYTSPRPARIIGKVPCPQ